MDAVFKDTRQALHIAFAVLSQEPRGESVLTKGLIRMLEAMADLTPRQEMWLNQLRGERSGTVNFVGLTSDEIRAQCADVISAVRTKLHHAEQWAVMARFGQMTVVLDPESGEQMTFFPPERAVAIQQLATWVQQSFATISASALECMLVKVFANHEKMQVTFRELAKEFGGNHMTYHRAYPHLRLQMDELENTAIARLRPYFERTHLVESETTEIV